MKRPRSKLKLANGGGPDLPWVKVEFGSSLDKAREVEQQILDACEANHFGSDDIFAIKLALEEALVNAVRHGNKLDPAKLVRVSYHINAQRADVTIEDQGPGFNPASVKDPCADENLECCSGRGILLMRAYMSSVVFNPQGNKVTMTRFNEAYAPKSAIG